MKLKKIILVILFIFLILLSMLLYILNGSLPDFSGKKYLPGLIEQVIVESDQYGIPTIRGMSRADVARATGFIHGQERFFQMDLMRRTAAGELSELFGNATVELDKERRLHCFRKQAQLVLPTLSSSERNLLKAYTEGVNTGLETLNCRPFEYFVLREKPIYWKEEDSILVGIGLFFELQDPMGSTDWVRGILKASLPLQVYEFFTQNGSIWDAPLDQSSISVIPIPEVEHFQYLTNTENKTDLSVKYNFYPITKGSNQWAIDSSLSTSRNAILACDMHLNLSVPNIWYRLSINYFDERGEHIQVNGVSLPGTPLIAVGSNKHIAWGFTNAYIDTTDLVLLDIDPSNSDYYLTPKGSCIFEEKVEEIKIKGSPSIYYKITWTNWGPLHPKLFLGKKVAIRWIAHDLDCFNFRLVDLETITSSKDALRSLPDYKLPVLNFMVADKEGHIGWSFVGGIPKRSGYEPGLPISFTNGDNQWIGHLDHDQYPVLIDPPNKRLWTANNRVLHCSAFGKDYLNSIRAHQIRKRLFESDQYNLDDMYAIQLDDEAFFFDRWHKLLVKHLDLKIPKHRQLFSIINQWDHHCSSSSQGYFWIRTFREMVIHEISKRILSPCFLNYPDLNLNLIDLEEPIYLIASQQPKYLSNPDLDSWEAEFYKIINDMLDNNSDHLSKKTSWGKSNISMIQHPLSLALPFINFLIDMPKKPLSGDYYVPRVASASDGASIRLVVSPSCEEEGILNIPCGQSGHPLSKHYRDQHDAWLQGIPTAFLPGPTISCLYLLPK